MSDYNKAYYQKNKEKIKERSKKWYVDHKKEVSVRTKAFRIENPRHHWKTKLKQKYGISPEIYELMYNKQSGNCAICNIHKELNGLGNTNRLCVDHDHLTGIVRSLLCNTCNRVIGLIKEDLFMLQKAIQYIEKYK